MNRKIRGFSVLAISALAVVGGVGAGCNTDSPLGDLAAQCGLTCPAKGVADGNASITGVASIDAFFSSVVRFQNAADTISDGVRAELDGIALSVGLQAGASAADIKTAVAAKITANVDGSLTIVADPPHCSVTAKATLQAEAQCDAKFDPGSASVTCQGTCDVQAGAQVDCGASADLTCTGTAPSLNCTGTCQGECDLTAAATCSGTCNGTCNGTCSVKNADGSCAGSCSGTCQGTCKLEAAGTCSGSCKGQCTYKPATASCDASAQAHCTAKAGASVDCKGSCTGTVTPPSASAECTASAKADASVNATCTPPQLSVSFQLKASADVTFTAWLEGLKGHISNILALKAKLDGVVTAGADIASTGQTAISASFQTTLSGDVDFKTKTLVTACAPGQLKVAIGLVSGAGTTLAGSSQDAVTVLGSVGLGS
jgi:hypothetical protein